MTIQLIEGNDHSAAIRRQIEAFNRAQEKERRERLAVSIELSAQARRHQRQLLDSIGLQNLLLGFLLVVIVGNLLLDLYLHASA